MANERVNHAIAKIDSALALIEKRLQSGDISKASANPDSIGDNSAELLAMARREQAGHIADRDRTIAKLRADIADIGRLKDEEIARLREAVASMEDRASGHPPTNGGDPELEAKYQRLKVTAEATIAGLDRVIATASQQRSDHG